MCDARMATSIIDRFNAETRSTYDRCGDELALFVTKFAEPWFAEWEEPRKLIAHPVCADDSLRRRSQVILIPKALRRP